MSGIFDAGGIFLGDLSMKLLLTVAMLLLTRVAGMAQTTYPGVPPGPMRVAIENGIIKMGNNLISGEWLAALNGLQARCIRDEQNHKIMLLKGELFRITLTDGAVYAASSLTQVKPPKMFPHRTNTASAQISARLSGRGVELPLESTDRRIQVIWRAIGLDGSNYLRQEIEISSIREDLSIKEIVWFDVPLPGAKTWGRVDGSPVVVGPFFLGCEDPMATNLATPEEPGAFRLIRNARLSKGLPLVQSFVTGIAPAGQLRRAFLYYLERERAHPYRPFLHYNAWWDICWPEVQLNESMCLNAIRGFGESLITPYGVTMDSLVIDDGWDDPKTLWQFNQGFPRGFSALTELCHLYGTRVGVWLSPFGGYGKAKEERIQYGKKEGYEINRAGFSLAGSKYYTRFKNECLRMIRQYGVNYLKFDGIASGMYANGSGAEFLLDTEAMRQLMLELRKESPDLFINLTTGSWPSPFWLRYCDSLWRQGEDTAFSGKGSPQQQLINYRDKETFQNIVVKGPLYPLNSLMTCGVCYSRHGDPGNAEFNSVGLKEDIRSFFGGGSHLQELYISPGKMKPGDWKTLAEAANWSRRNADILVDTHWIGGNPDKDEVYGWAAWAPRKGIITLRNPADQVQHFKLDLDAALELPPGAARNYGLKSPWAEDASKSTLPAEAGVPLEITLQPFEILTWEAAPTNNQPTP
jgi:hypothetical protein